VLTRTASARRAALPPSHAPDPILRPPPEIHLAAYLVQERQERGSASHVAASFTSLQDDEVTACVDHRACLVERAHLPRHERTAIVHAIADRGVGVAVEALDDRGDRRRGVEGAVVEERHEEARPHPVAFTGGVDRSAELGNDVVRGESRGGDHAQATFPSNGGSQRGRGDAAHARPLDR
jgi:hypothetical protein